MGYLHREHVYPNFLQEYVEGNKDKKFKLENTVDDMGCTPKCAAHTTFGLEILDIVSCVPCDRVEDIGSVQSNFIHSFYVDQMLELNRLYPNLHNKLTPIIAEILKLESEFNITAKEEKNCKDCKKPLKLEAKWILEIPLVYAVGL